GGEGFSIDASLIKADAGRKQRVPGDEPIAWPRAEEASRAVREYLAALDAADHDEEIGGDDDGSSRGGKRRKPPKQVSLTDPQAAWIARKNTDPFFAYDANYLIDNKAGIIVDAEGTRANRIAEIAITETMIERVKSRSSAKPAAASSTTARSLTSPGTMASSQRLADRTGPKPKARSSGLIGTSARTSSSPALDDLNAQLRHWLDTVANPRVHATAQRVVNEA